MAEGLFHEATALLLILTFLCLGVNALGWMRLRALKDLVVGRRSSLSEREIEGLGQLNRLIRAELLYFALLLLYALFYPGVLAWGPVLFVVLYHGMGGIANEVTRATERAVAHVRENLRPSPSFRERVRRALAIIGALDAVEAVILLYIAWALVRALRP